MKRIGTLVFVLTVSVGVVAQEKETTTVTSKTTTVASDVDLLGPPLWSMQDATPVPPGAVSLRLGGNWSTASAPANGGDSDDDFVLTPHIVIGTCPNVELAIGVQNWLGDSGDMGPLEDGNYDTSLSILWRFLEQKGLVPAMALRGAIRTPTGRGSSGVDGELRLILTNQYDSGIRSHINGFLTSANGNNDESTRYIADDETFPDNRHFQWGMIFGLDGPLCADCGVRWVADYVHRSSYHYGASNLNLLEFGLEWQIAEGHTLGMSNQVGLDENEDTPNFGAGIEYAYTIMTK